MTHGARPLAPLAFSARMTPPAQAASSAAASSGGSSTWSACSSAWAPSRGARCTSTSPSTTSTVRTGGCGRASCLLLPHVQRKLALHPVQPHVSPGPVGCPVPSCVGPLDAVPGRWPPHRSRAAVSEKLLMLVAPFLKRWTYTRQAEQVGGGGEDGARPSRWGRKPLACCRQGWCRGLAC